MQDEKITTIPMPQTGKGLKYVFQLFRAADAITGICMAQTFTFNKDTSAADALVKEFDSKGQRFRAFNGNFAWQQDAENSWLFIGSYLVHMQKGKDKNEVFDLKPYGVKKGYCMTVCDSELWLGTDAGIIMINDNKLIKRDSIGHEKLGQVLSFLTDKNNRLWIASDVGLFSYANKQFEAVTKGTTTGSNYCTGITYDATGKIWVATWDGIFYIDGKTKRYLNTNDGLPSKTANCIIYDSATAKIYIGLDNGLASLSESAFTSPITVRDIFISCNIAGNDSNIVNNNSKLPSSQNSLNFYLSFPYYQGSEDVVFEYKIDKGSWTTAITPSVVISDIASGKHIFYARAKANDEVISKDDTSFTFTIETPYYETWWFWVIAALILQLIIFRFINHYNKKAREEKLAEQSQKAEYASLKQQAFTLLMNPHFIFNALNSVQHYVNKQDRQSANKYLSDFATLIRRSFEASQRSFVTLDEELETIRLYLQLEKMRFVEKFDYTINVSTAASEEDWMLPSMMLQPFLENAILHGLMPLTEKGLLTIEATAGNNSLCITITDNGVGIEKSKALRSGSKHNSKGMQLIKERIELLSKLSKEPIQLSITALNPGAVNPGTKIIMIIPQEVYTVFQKQRNPA
jgi:anti-sigma regulatory factor (Ser/Thr protein kinase)